MVSRRPKPLGEPETMPAIVSLQVQSVLADLGGVLETGSWPGIARVRAPRLGITTGELLAAVFGGSDETVLVGAMSEDDWWQQHVRPRLGISPGDAGPAAS